MGKKDTDKKWGRLSTILEIITNLGQIVTWVLGVGSAYVLNIQTKPIVVPGIDITLDLGFQFALLISAMLGYVHFLQKYWEKNQEKLKLSETFLDFSFWDLPRFKQPLLLIPIVIAFAIFIQVTSKSIVLSTVFPMMIGIILVFVASRFYFYLSPNRRYEKLLELWQQDTEWFERWSKRIKGQLASRVGVRESDLVEVGMTGSKKDKLEIVFALHQYFEKFEFESDLVLVRSKELSFWHPLHSSDANEWVLLPRMNLDIDRHSK
jgi:hypothetical protein